MDEAVKPPGPGRVQVSAAKAETRQRRQREAGPAPAGSRFPLPRRRLAPRAFLARKRPDNAGSGKLARPAAAWAADLKTAPTVFTPGPLPPAFEEGARREMPCPGGGTQRDSTARTGQLRLPHVAVRR